MEGDLQISFEGDLHICGSCNAQECTIEKFLNHKHNCQKSRKTVISQLQPINTTLEEINYALEPENDLEVVVGDNEIADNSSSGDLTYPEVGEVIVPEENSIKNSTQDIVNTFETFDKPCLITSTSADTVNLESEDNCSIKPRIITNVSEQINPPPDNSQIKYELVVDPENKTKRFHCKYENCAYSSIYYKDIVRHFVVHTGAKPYSCKHCDKRFSRIDKVKLHELTHTGVKPHKCPQCSYAALEKSSLVKHLRIHKDERPYKCQTCTYASRNSSQLTIHLRRHTGDTPYHCTQCKKKFKMNSDLKRHMLLHSGEKPYSCNQCAFQCRQQGNLKKHKRRCHDVENVMSCQYCEFATNAKSKLIQHERGHTNKALSCNQCEYNTTTLSALKIHQRVHNKNKPFRCKYCSYTSRQACNVSTHTKIKHPDQERVPTQPIILKKKIKDQESKLCSKTFKCQMCDASFVRKDSLKSHCRQHENQITRRIEPRPKPDSLNFQNEIIPSTSSTTVQTETVLITAINEAISDVAPVVIMSENGATTLSYQSDAVLFRQSDGQIVYQ